MNRYTDFGDDNVIRFTVLGDPIAKGRARSRIAKTKDGKQFIAHYTPKKTAIYERSIAWQAKSAMQGRQPIDDACEVTVTAYMRIPASWAKNKKESAHAGLIFPTTKPDVDNIFKAVADGMNGIVYTDDSRICGLNCEKHYSNVPRIEVEVRRAVYQPF